MTEYLFKYRLAKLRLAAAGLGFTLKFKEVDSDGLYVYLRRAIYVDKDLEPEDALAVVLHEMGHMIDDLSTSIQEDIKINKAYTAIEGARATKYHKRIVMAREKRAWICGENLAKMLRIPLGKWFYRMKTECLKSYKQN